MSHSENSIMSHMEQVSCRIGLLEFLVGDVFSFVSYFILVSPVVIIWHDAFLREDD